ncbi:MAG TPA: o-succinylbenzoate synthase [Clostridiales bacterium]|nr:o-succinylbenzoate synthase [Clostridiales bacterium]
MYIDAVNVYYLKMPLVTPWRTAYGEDAYMHTVLVCLNSSGKKGWSETGPLVTPTYSPEYTYGVYYLLTEFFAHHIKGREISSPDRLLELLSQYKGNPFAKAALETAWWTLESNVKGVPLYKLLGGSLKEVEVGADFGIHDNINELILKMERAYSSGFKRIKLKVKPGKDNSVLKEVRKHFPDQIIHVDCNSGYTLKDLPVFIEMDKYNLHMIEQPLAYNDLHDHAVLQSKINTPVCLDESINSVKAAREALELKSCKLMNIKTGRVGGLKNSVEIIELCKEKGVGCWVGAMLEAGIASGAGIAISTLDNIVYPGDIFPSGTMCREEISKVEIKLSSPGHMKPLDFPGFPYEPREDILKKYTVFSKTI